VTKRPVSIPLTRSTGDGDWWMSIGYLATDASTVGITAGDRTIRSGVISGLGTLFVHLPGDYDHVVVDPPVPGITLCVDQIEVGVPVSGDS
jgi:hypothetical protein